MKASLKNHFAVLFCCLLACGARAWAQSATNAPFASAELTLDDNFHSGRCETAVQGGAFFSPAGNPKHRPTINYAVGDVELGYMVTEPGADGFFRGNLELVPEGFGGGVFLGPGNYLAGGTLWFRYNFVQRGWRVKPYFELGGGFVFTDIDREIVGEAFNFNLDGAVGLRYFVVPACAINLEYRFQHISNADLGPRNVGVNSDGAFLGASWFF